MRKYYQAALLVIAVVSLVSLLFYRHEYNKLRYVLEVFNYFGKPNLKNVETNCTNNEGVVTKFNMKLDEPLSSWQRLNNDLYIYSAYNIRDAEVQAVAFGSPNSIKDMQCMIFFKVETEPVLGNFSYLSIDTDLSAADTNRNFDYKAYHLYCVYLYKHQIPVGIRFFTKSNRNINDVPILSIERQPHNLDFNNVGICVTPPLVKPIEPVQMISFLNFHDMIGVHNFIVYDFGIPNDLSSKFKDLSKSQDPYWKFTYTNVPWNFPFPGTHPAVIKDLIQADCLYRTYNKIMYIITLSWEEYIILRYHHTLIDLITDFKKSRMQADRYKLKILTFCIKQKDSTNIRNATYMIFKELHFDSSIHDNHPIYIHKTHEVLTRNNTYIRDIGNNLVTLNRYKDCFESSNSDSKVEDKTILKFFEDIKNSPIYRKFMAWDTNRSE